jgi:nucleoside-diphosphate-sugar epimerase
VATTRSAEKQAFIRRLGGTPVIVDALDASALDQAVRSAAPTHVIHELTALPKAGPRRSADLEATNRLRIEGTRNLLRAATAAGVRRLIVGSFAPIGSANPESWEDEIRGAAEAIRSMESQVLDAARSGAIEGIVLRYGMFYGPGNPATEEMIALVRKRRLPTVRNDRGMLPFIHVDDAVAATIAALDRGRSGNVYDIVDDQPTSFSEMIDGMAAIMGAPRPFAVPAWLIRLMLPFTARVLLMNLRLSNARAKADLGWTPAFPSYREGLRQVVQAA